MEQRRQADPAQATDPDLAGMVAAGDPGAFEVLMRRHNGALYRTARSIVRDDAEAEDIRGTAYTVVGPVGPVAEFVGRREVVARQDVGAYASATVRGRAQDQERRLADELSLDLTPVSLQELVAHATTVRAEDTRTTQGADR